MPKPYDLSTVIIFLSLSFTVAHYGRTQIQTKSCQIEPSRVRTVHGKQIEMYYDDLNVWLPVVASACLILSHCQLKMCGNHCVLYHHLPYLLVSIDICAKLVYLSCHRITKQCIAISSGCIVLRYNLF